ncbi:MAG: hypothetical protein J7K62_03270 [Thermoplasmata archaeon]|nr:hypothetical protein [Thermoplasmata archaeon]
MKKEIIILLMFSLVFSVGKCLTLSKQTFDLTLDRGQSVVKSITIQNDKNYTVDISVSKEGSIASWIFLNDFSTSLSESHSSTISFSINVPDDANYGNYTGKLKIVESGNNNTETYYVNININVMKGKSLIFDGSVSTDNYLSIGPYDIFVNDVGMTSTCLITVSYGNENLTENTIVGSDGIDVGNLSIRVLSTFIGNNEQKCSMKIESTEDYSYELNDIEEQLPEDVIKLRGTVAPGGWVVIETSVNDRLVSGSLLIEIPNHEPISKETYGLTNILIPDDAGGKPMTITYYNSKGERVDYMVSDISSESVSNKKTNMNVIIKDKFNSDEDIVFQVIDENSLDPIAGVKIYLDVPCDIDRWGMTDNNGVVSFSGSWCEGLYKYKVTKKGYDDVFGNLTVNVKREDISIIAMYNGEISDTLISGREYTFEVESGDRRAKDYDVTAEILIGNNTYNLAFDSGKARFKIPNDAMNITIILPKTGKYNEYSKTFMIEEKHFSIPTPIIYIVVLTIVLFMLLLLIKNGKFGKKGPVIAPPSDISEDSYPVEEA